MEPISESDLQSLSVVSTPTPSMVSFPSTKMPMSPRARPAMPAGPRIRKSTQHNLTTLSINGRTTPVTTATNGRRASSDSAAALTSGRNTPTLSTGSPQSPPLEHRFLNQPLTEDKQVQTDDPALPPPKSDPAPKLLPQTLSSKAGFTVTPKPVTLPVPTPINFTAEQVSFRGLNLDVAQWKFSSDELRDIVSRAIRDSAKESFIRLLSPEVLDKEAPSEMERLDSLKFTTQAQHRFHFQRRTNLLQSLNAFASTIPHNSDDGVSPIASLTSQLAEITSAMDRFTESLLHIADQKSQITHVLDIHLSSALAMALRKLNASYSKRTADLKQVRSRIEELEAELEEAWKVAEDMAQEIDDLDNFEQDYGLGDDINGEDEVQGELTVDDEDFTTTSAINAQLVGITGKAVASKATLVASPTSETHPTTGPSDPPRKRDRAQSTSSTGRSGSSNRGRSSRVSAARRRSIRTSKANLRIPKALVTPASGSEGSASGTSTPRKRSRSNAKKSPSELPSVPPIPSGICPSTSQLNGQMNTSFLELSRPASPQQSSDEDIPPVPILNMIAAEKVVVVNAKAEDDDRATIQVKEDLLSCRAEVDGSFPPSTSVDTGSHLARPSSHNSDQLNRLQSTSEAATSKQRRTQSMQPPSVVSTLASGDSMFVNLDEDREDGQDSPVVPGISRPLSDDHRTMPFPQNEQKRPASDYDKFDRWPWSSAKRMSVSVKPYPPPSPALSFVPALGSFPEDHSNSQRQRGVASSSVFRLKDKRRSMPLPSAAIATLLPWRGDARRPSSEPELPSQAGPRSPLSA